MLNPIKWDFFELVSGGEHFGALFLKCLKYYSG
jgi:hypothetical protein